LHVELSQISKRYQKQSIFREVSHLFTPGSCTAVIGNNGSGKSTLLQIIAGYASPSQGTVKWEMHNNRINRDNVFRFVSICSPALQLWDELTLSENHALFTQFKQLPECNTSVDFARIIQLEKHINKPLKTFSSGMRQRVKLGFAILSDAPLLLLDEPCSHMDGDAVLWYQEVLQKHAQGKTIIVASNRDHLETFLCNEEIDINDYKP
jgi:ABC-type multidrug transport system ATPase subunit